MGAAKPVISDQALVSQSMMAAADFLGLERQQIANAVGLSVPTVARLKNGKPIPGQKPFELALLLIRIYRALYAIVGGSREQMQHWMKTPNHHFNNEVPVSLIQTPDGLSRVLWYLDAMRGRL